MTPLVFFPELHGDAQAWAPVLRALPDDLTATALDLPAVSGFDALADEAARRVPVGRIVAGHSLGGMAATLVLVAALVDAEAPEPAAAHADRATTLSEAYEEIALDGMEAVCFGDRGRDPQVRAERLRAARVCGPWVRPNAE